MTVLNIHITRWREALGVALIPKLIFGLWVGPEAVRPFCSFNARQVEVVERYEQKPAAVIRVVHSPNGDSNAWNENRE